MRRTEDFERWTEPAPDGVTAAVSSTLAHLAPAVAECSCRGFVVKVMDLGEPKPDEPVCCDKCGRPGWRVYFVYPSMSPMSSDDIRAIMASDDADQGR
jgi:hypothetical protein